MRFIDELRAIFGMDALRRNHRRLLPMLVVYPFLLLLLDSWMEAVAITIGYIAVIEYTLQRYFTLLGVRIQTENSLVWDVEINLVKVGAITDAEYAGIRLRVFSHPRPYYAQVLNILRVAFNAVDYMFRSIPLGAFWIGVGLALFDPDSLVSAFSALQRAAPAEVKQYISMAGMLFVLTAILAVAMHWVMGLSRFGFVNRFAECVATEVRLHCTVAAEGSLRLRRWTPGGPVFNDEAAFLRRRS